MQKEKRILWNALFLLDHVYNKCKNGNHCTRHCAEMRKRIDHSITCTIIDCDLCRRCKWFIQIHGQIHCFFPWKCKVPGCVAETLVIRDLVNMGIDQEFLETCFH